MILRCAIVDDEPLALGLLESYVNKTPFLQLTGKYSSAVQAMKELPGEEVDLLFLDIQMPELNGLEFSQMVDSRTRIVFTTAFGQYAIDGYRVNALDYLLKPIDADDIRKALDKLSRLQSTAVEKEAIDYSAVMQALKRVEGYKTHFLIPMKGDKLLPVSVDMILFFYIADGNVKAVMTDGKEYLFTQTLDELADSLDPALFFRINRQYLISRKAVQDIDLWFNGRLAINLIVPTLDRILVSKARVPDFKTWFTS